MKQKQCRMCKGMQFKEVVDFGLCPLVNSLVETADQKDPVYPLKVEQCQRCFLVQIVNPIDANKIYRDEDYLYHSSDMPNLSEYFSDYARDVDERFQLEPSDLVVEIGSNDGILLEQFDCQILGVDPATNVVVRALSKKIPTISDFFTERLSKHIKRYFGQAKVISGNNCIAHIHNLYDVMKGVVNLLSQDGIFVVECNYWGGMVKNKNYGLIYHDHFSYFTLENWVNYTKQFGLEVFDAFVTPAQGGSLRLFVCFKGKYLLTERFKEMLLDEERTNLNSYETAHKYRDAVFSEAKNLSFVLSELKKQGKRIAGYGASAKGLSILQFAKVREGILEYIVDDSPAKQGKYTPVSHIPILSKKDIQFVLPDYFLLTAPNYKDVIVAKEEEYFKNGGKFLTVGGEIIG